ncbi:MAG: efflux RND transporter permease subunit [Candidatus Eremiobacteraeota bacterium]|nr:efflux RND transporter permease subunit [Candidatus Eremiobacteraeota bacterium]MBV8339907.1 efflux RND transporter permease subunit [Candidatus Eremiobacteraeota bacterium]MBV8460592.1 efflux RND transporter permease subunit [Candidatus Eremiobacteraeota bacterium]MBV8669077.1 efflux RND transporter permease subunit [Candidatus Eremiobacteraeota bacterium]
MWLTRFAIKNPTIVTLFFVAVLLFGFIGYRTMGQNINPNVTLPFVDVNAYYPGASPDEMERLIAKPIEDQLQNIDHVQHIWTSIEDGVVDVTVQFNVGTDVNFAATDVQQAVDQARQFLPADLDPPEVSKNNTAGDPILLEAISSYSMKPNELSNIITNEIIPDLRNVKGVGGADAGGLLTRQITVEPDVAKLGALGATLLDVNNAVGQGNVSLPGGLLNQPSQESTVGVRADIRSADEIAALPLTIPGTTAGLTKVGDVANVVDGFADQRNISSLNGHPGIVLAVVRDANSDTKNTTDAVRAEFKQLGEKYPQISFRELVAGADFMHDSIKGVLQNLMEGIALTALVLLFFLHVWRSALVVMIAIPASIFATFFVMWLLGMTIDLLSLMALSLIVGILVDDSIVVLENITRHRLMGKAPEEAAIEGRTEIGGAAIAITLVDVVVFAPIAFMSGIVGQFLREFALVIVVATMFSLFVSFTLTPLLAAHWALAQRPRPVHDTKSRGFQGVLNRFAEWFEHLRKSYHDVALPWAMKRPWAVIGACVGLVILSFVPLALQIVPFEFQPTTDWGSAIVDVTYPPGTPIAVTAASVERLEEAILKMDGVQSVSGDAGHNNGVRGGYAAELHVTLDQRKRHNEDQVIVAVKKLGYLVPGARLDAAHGDTGGQAPISYDLSGASSEQVEAGAQKLKAYIASLPNAENVQTSTQIAGPRLQIDIDRQRAALLGVSPENAAMTARAAIGGVIATKVRMPEGLINAMVQLPPGTRNDENQLRSVMVRADNGNLVPLSDVATFSWMHEPTQLSRRDRQRIVTVSAFTKNGAPISTVQSKADAILKDPNFLPAGVTVKTSEGSDSQLLGDTLSKIGLALMTSFVLIYMLLVVLYRNYLSPFIIMFTVPLAFIGVSFMLTVVNILHDIPFLSNVRYLQGQTLNIFSLLGVVMLTGLVAKNGILLVDYANTLRTRGLSVAEAMHESAAIRFRPIIMTTASMVFGMLPLALGITEGAEFRKSIGTVIIGGLLSSLLLTLFLIPVIYVMMVGALQRFHDRRERRRLAAIAEEEEEEAEEAEPVPQRVTAHL